MRRLFVIQLIYNVNDLSGFILHCSTLHFLIYFERIEEDGIPSGDKEDAVVSRIERIVRDELNCAMPFDEQTMEHVRALIGAYSSLLIENYSQR
jgi:hypothetical protein